MPAAIDRTTSPPRLLMGKMSRGMVGGREPEHQPAANRTAPIWGMPSYHGTTTSLSSGYGL